MVGKSRQYEQPEQRPVDLAELDSTVKVTLTQAASDFYVDRKDPVGVGNAAAHVIRLRDLLNRWLAANESAWH